MRFHAPARDVVSAAVFAHPAFAAYAEHLDLLRQTDWPSVDELDRRLVQRYPHAPLHFVEQSLDLLADGLHYETRIHACAQIATRPRNWHDLLNALVWIEFRDLKAALNRRQVDDIARVGSKARTRGQCALTHFDEAGAIVFMCDDDCLQAWDAHRWHELFWQRRSAWLDGSIAIEIFGHALLEHALEPDRLFVAKALVIKIADPRDAAQREVAMTTLCSAIRRGEVLADPQELRPLPLSGIPGWHAGTDREDFYREGPCFRPLREGRSYPDPLRVEAVSNPCDTTDAQTCARVA